MKSVNHPKFFKNKPMILGFGLDDISFGFIVFLFGTITNCNPLLLIILTVASVLTVRVFKRLVDYKTLFLSRIEL